MSCSPFRLRMDSLSSNDHGVGVVDDSVADGM